MSKVLIPVQCLACGITGEVLRVTAGLLCRRCGSNDLDLWDGVKTGGVVRGDGEGWDSSRPDPAANWNEYAGPTPSHNPGSTQQNVSGADHVCQICHGTGKTTIGGGGYDESVCRNCHGTGKVTYSGESHGGTNDGHTSVVPPLGASDNKTASVSWTSSGGGGGYYTGDNGGFGPTFTSSSPITYKIVVPGVGGKNKLVSAGQGDKIMAMAAHIVEVNSGLTTQEAFELARRAVTAFPEA